MVQCIITRSFNLSFIYTLSARGKAVNGFNSICGRKGVIINMRLDKYLKVSRLIKRRTVANEACDAGKISVNGKIARASYDVKTGDIIEITLGSRCVKVRVTEVKEVVRKEDAAAMYEPV